MVTLRLGYFAPEAQSTFGAFGPFAVIARGEEEGEGGERERKVEERERKGEGEGGEKEKRKDRARAAAEGPRALSAPLASGPCFFLAGALPFLGNLYLCLLMGWLGPFLS